MENKPVVHFIPEYFLAPRHPISITIVGAGGTGSRLLRELIVLHQALRALNKPGLFVRLWDGDCFSPANVGRQLCNTEDVGQNKAVTLISRANAFAGTQWQACPKMWHEDEYESAYGTHMFSNIMITCVDSAEARIQIFNAMKRIQLSDDTNKLYYWLDLGNTRTVGQAILGTIKLVPQPTSQKYETVPCLPHVFHLFGNISRFDTEEQQGPSCSLAEALRKQDLFINAEVALAGAKLLWPMLKGEFFLTRHQIYINQDTYSQGSALIQSQKTENLYLITPKEEKPGEPCYFTGTMEEAKSMGKGMMLAMDEIVRVYRMDSRYQIGQCIKEWKPKGFRYTYAGPMFNRYPIEKLPELENRLV